MMLLAWITLFILHQVTEGASVKGRLIADCRSPEPNSFYKIVSFSNKKAKTVVHDHLVMFPYVGWDNQLWRFVPVGQGFFKIKSKDTSRIISMDESKAIVMVSDVDETDHQWYMLNAENGSCSIYSRRYKKIVTASSKAGNSSKHQWGIYEMSNATEEKLSCFVPPNDAVQSKLVKAGQVYLLRNSQTTNLLGMELADPNVYVKQWILTPDSFECGLYTIHSDLDQKYALSVAQDGVSVQLEIDNPKERTINRLWSVVREDETFFAFVSRSSMKVLANKQLPDGNFIFYMSTWKTSKARQLWSLIVPGCRIDSNHYYAIVSTSTGMAVTLQDAEIMQKNFVLNAAEQLWQPINVGQFYFFRVKSNSRMFAHDDNKHSVIGVNQDITGDPSQWAWYSDVGGTCVIYAKGSKEAMGVADNSTHLTLNASNNSNNQKWHFIQQEEVTIGSTCFSSPDDAMTTKLVNSMDDFIVMNALSRKNIEFVNKTLIQHRYRSDHVEHQLWRVRTAHGACGFYKLYHKNAILTVRPDGSGVSIENDDPSDTDPRQLWKISRGHKSYFVLTSRSNNLTLESNGLRNNAPVLMSLQTTEKKRSQMWKFYTPGCNVNTSYLYAITAFHSGMVLTVEGESVVQRTYHGLKTQMWRFVSTRNGFYNIRSYMTGNLVLTVHKDRMLMVTEEATGSDRQWYVDKNVAGTCSLFSRKYRMYADVPLSSNSEGRNVIVFFPGTEANQRWTFTKIAYSTPFADECSVPPEDAFLKKMLNPNESYVIMDHLSEKVFHQSYDITKEKLPLVLWEYKSCNNTNLFWSVKPVGCGLYKIMSLLNGKVLSVNDKNPEVQIELNDPSNINKNQIWSIRHERETYLSITSLSTMLNLEVEDAKDGAPITQSIWKFGGGSQLWSFFVPGCQVDQEAYYAIVALHSGQVLTIQNDAIVQWSYMGWANQLWQFQSIGEGFFNIRSKVKGVIAGVINETWVMPVPETLALEKQWYMYNSTEGTCSIYSRMFRKVLDVKEGSKHQGTRVVIYGAENERHQRWTFIKVDKAPKLPKTCYTPPIDALHTKLINSGDSYALMDKNSELDLEVPFSATDNFAPLKQWEKREANTTVQKWKIRPVPVECGLYKIVSEHNDKVLTADPEYNSIYLDNDDNQNQTINQLWSISLEEETYFNIVSRGTMKALETSGTKNGSMVVQSDWKHRDKGQEWSFMGLECKVNDQNYYAIVAKSTGKVLTKSTDEVVQWSYNGDDSQLWKFVRLKTGYQIQSKTTSQFITLDHEGNAIKVNDTAPTPWNINSGKLGFCNIMTEGDNVIGTDADMAEEKKVNVYNRNFASNQQWNIVKIEGSLSTN